MSLVPASQVGLDACWLRSLVAWKLSPDGRLQAKRTDRTVAGCGQQGWCRTGGWAAGAGAGVASVKHGRAWGGDDPCLHHVLDEGGLAMLVLSWERETRAAAGERQRGLGSGFGACLGRD